MPTGHPCILFGEIKTTTHTHTHKIGLLPNFQSGCLLLSCMSCLYILEIKISIQKLITFLYINNETSEWECKKKKTFKIAKKKKKKNLRIILTKVVKDLYTKNYKTLINEVKKNSKKWNDIPCS